MMNQMFRLLLLSGRKTAVIINLWQNLSTD